MGEWKQIEEITHTQILPRSSNVFFAAQFLLLVPVLQDFLNIGFNPSLNRKMYFYSVFGCTGALD